MEEALERRESGIHPLLADREQLRLGAIDRLLDLRRVLIADAGDPPGGTDEIARPMSSIVRGGALNDPVSPL